MKGASVLVFMPCDSSYDFAMIRSLEEAISLPEGMGTVTKCLMAFKNIVGARNNAAKIVLEEDYSHLLFLDSDMVFEKGTLVRLLSHDVDVVGAAYCKKLQPYHVNAFRKRKDGLLEHFFPPKELIEVTGLGTGCMLIKREVFEKMEKKFPKQSFFYYRQSEIPGMEWQTTTEDIVFCENAIRAGCKVYCDGTLYAGHIGQYVIWPENEQGVSLRPFKAAKPRGKVKLQELGKNSKQ